MLINNSPVSMKVHKMLFTKEKTNLGRQIEVDLSRGFTALLIVTCHVGLYLGNPNDVGFFVFSDISGSEFGAPVFIALMGLSMIYSKNQTPKFLAQRGIMLLIGGFILSTFRSLLPMLLFGEIDEWCTLGAFFVVDILQFAGLSLLLFALFKKLNLPSWAVLIISLVMVGIGQIVMRLPEPLVQNEWAGYFVNLFFPITEWSCFPLFTWFFFPAFGLCFGEILIRCQNKNLLYGILLPISLCGVLFVYLQFHFLYPDYTSYYWGNNFYYMGIKNVLLTALFITFSLSFWHFTNKILPNFIRTFLKFLSSNLNLFYVLTWVFISVLIHLFAYWGYSLNSLAAIGVMVLLIALCALTTKGILILKKRYAK